MDRNRLTLLLGMVVVTAAAVVVAVVATGGDDDAPPVGPGAEAPATPSTTTTSTSTTTMSVAPEPAPTTATTIVAPETTDAAEPAVGDHPICPEWDAYVTDLDSLPVDTPEDLERLNERRLAFFGLAVELLEGDERDAAADFLTYHRELEAFWPPFGWDFEAYTMAFIEDPDGVPEVPWPASGSDVRWRQVLTDRCGLEFVTEETA